ncbi:hypothetical protein D1647_23400 [Alistipes sp. Z76]|nr:hypothetical protein [Alistipes sp. Z76]NCE71091.1 hypothetical protein [Muribaculaceae bacterium M3]
MRKRRSEGRKRDGSGGSGGGGMWGLWSGWMSARMNGEKCSGVLMSQRKVGGGPGERGGGIRGRRWHGSPAAAPGAHKRRAPGTLVLGAREGAVIYFPAFAVSSTW